jgi:cytochrome c
VTRSGWRPLAALALPVVLAVVLTACGTRPTPTGPAVDRGDANAGQVALAEYGCNSCHHIPGIRNADSLVAPPLNSWSQRNFIAGLLPNTQTDLERWIQNPQDVQPGNAMPNLGVTEIDARDMAAYLLSLR